MSDPLKFTLPVPPSANRYWRHRRNGQIYVSDEAKNYKAAAVWLIKCNRLITEEVEIELKFYRERRAGDLDNRIKVILDALQGVAIENDSQVVKITAERFEDKDSPRVEVEIRIR